MRIISYILFDMGVALVHNLSIQENYIIRNLFCYMINNGKYMLFDVTNKECRNSEFINLTDWPM